MNSSVSPLPSATSFVCTTTTTAATTNAATASPTTTTTNPPKFKIGFVGLGKLGMPCAVAMSLKGHDVKGYDIRKEAMQKETFPHVELGPNGEPSLEPFVQNSTLTFGTLSEVIQHSELLFVAIQTPHDVRYEGITRIPPERIDFNYEPLVSGMKHINQLVAEDQTCKSKIIIIISTVLPGTIRKHILPLLCNKIKLCYNPYFIAMGQVLRDFYYPEFVLFGVVDKEAEQMARLFYSTIHSAPFFSTSLENAELIKVAYNTMISMKLSFVNTLMEACHYIPGTDIDQVTAALKLGHQRIVSPAYLTGGMGDGGGCHPRDNIALSHLARALGLKFDLFDSIMMQREKQAEFFASLVEKELLLHPDFSIQLFGVAYKPHCTLCTGSHALLVHNVLKEHGHSVNVWDPWVLLAQLSSVSVSSAGPVSSLSPVSSAVSSATSSAGPVLSHPSVIFIGQKHNDFLSPDLYVPGSIVIDPHRYLPKSLETLKKIKIIYVGVGNDGKDGKD